MEETTRCFLESVWRKKPAHLKGQILRYQTWETLGCHSLLPCISQSPSAIGMGTRSSSEVNSSPRVSALLTSCAIEIPFSVCYNVKWKRADYAYVVTPTVADPSPLSKLHSQTFTELHLVPVGVSQHPSEWPGAKGNLKSILNFLNYWPLFVHVGIKASGCQQLRRHFCHALRPINS